MRSGKILQLTQVNINTNQVRWIEEMVSNTSPWQIFSSHWKPNLSALSTTKGSVLIWNFIASSHRLKHHGVQTHISWTALCVWVVQWYLTPLVSVVFQWYVTPLEQLQQRMILPFHRNGPLQAHCGWTRCSAVLGMTVRPRKNKEKHLLKK